MVVAGKIFRVSGSVPISNIATKLSGYHVEENYEEAEHKFKLVTEISGLDNKRNMLNGTFVSDSVIHVLHRGTSAPLPQTVEAAFSFAQVEKTTFLTIVEKKRVANLIANKLSEILFQKIGIILQVRIPPKILSEFHHKNREDTKITFFDNVDIPNVNKLSLYGPDLINTSLFEDYAKHGDLWYVVARSKETSYVVGITRDASVTIFNTAEKNKYIEYIAKEIYPIILAPT